MELDHHRTELIDQATYQGVVYPWHCDHMGHVNVMWYINMFDQATWSLVASIGLPVERLRQLGRGMAAVRQEVTYRRELQPGDAVRITTDVLEVRERVLRMHHRMVVEPGQETAAEMTLVSVHLDTTERRAVAFPSDVRARAQHLVAARTTRIMAERRMTLCPA